MSDFTETRILYMEDDPALSVLLQKSLQRQGFVVDTAANGEEGIAMAGAAPYDVLLVDYNMPFLGGIDVLRTLTWKDTFPPTIIVTGEGNVDIAVEALKLGAADYIVKDVGLKYLKLLPMVIDRVINKRQLTHEHRLMEVAIPRKRGAVPEAGRAVAGWHCHSCRGSVCVHESCGHADPRCGIA